MSKGPKTHHVVPNSDGGWDVKRGGAGRASRLKTGEWKYE